MTCIVGLVDGGNVWVGGDSLGSSGSNRVIRSDEKVFLRGEFLFGFTTSFRMGQLLRYAFTAPERKEGIEDHEYLATVVIDAIRDCLKAGGYAKKTNEAEEGGDFLIGYRGGLYHVGPDYQVGIPANRYYAVGAGADFALGALHGLSSLRTTQFSAELLLTRALEAAAEHCAFVAPPWVIKSV